MHVEKSLQLLYPRFCSPHLLGEVWWKQLGVPAGRCSTEKGGIAKPGHCCQDTPRAITAPLQLESFGSFWWPGWCPWTPTTRDIPEEGPLMYFWHRNLSFIGFLESCLFLGNKSLSAFLSLVMFLQWNYAHQKRGRVRVCFGHSALMPSLWLMGWCIEQCSREDLGYGNGWEFSEEKSLWLAVYNNTK